ncbi:MAG: DUF2796 domain-containing protein [Halioglobus sp.]
MKTNDVRSIPLLAPLSVVACSLVPLQTFGESGHHSAHIHGVAELTLALEGTRLEIEFNSPALGVLGFEHKVSSSTQLEAVENARASLRDAASLFEFAGTSCALQSVTVDMSSVLESKSDHDARRDEHKSHDSGTSHSDVNAHYDYKCADGEQLQSVRVGKKALPFDLQKIKALWVLENTQGSTVLSTSNQVILLN